MLELFHELLERHGPRGWWPLYDRGSGEFRYRPGDHEPVPAERRAEIAIGALLTQNTSWTNVIQALTRLQADDALSWSRIRELPADRLEVLIRPSGYFRQKTRKLKLAASFFEALDGVPRRAELLDIWGIGPETADSILLYGYDRPVAVVDAYLRRILARRGRPESEWPYERLRAWLEAELPADSATLGEFHALIVAEAVRSGRPAAAGASPARLTSEPREIVHG